MSEYWDFKKVGYVGNKTLTSGDGFHFYNPEEVILGKKWRTGSAFPLPTGTLLIND